MRYETTQEAQMIEPFNLVRRIQQDHCTAWRLFLVPHVTDVATQVQCQHEISISRTEIPCGNVEFHIKNFILLSFVSDISQILHIYSVNENHSNLCSPF